MSSSIVDLETVTLACQAFQSSVERYIKKRQQKSGKPYSSKCLNDIKQGTEHACYVLKTLYKKRTSLEVAVDVFVNDCGPTILKQLEQQLQRGRNNNNNDDDVSFVVLRLFTWWFRNYLRLRDSLILLVSGECRHVGDIRQSRKATQYKSNLNTTNKKEENFRKDGYTKLYSSDYYSGYGWDELFAQQVGIQTRLVQALMCGSGGSIPESTVHRVWDTILSKCEMFDTCLNVHDTSMTTLKQKIEKHASDFVTSVNKMLASSLMSTESKLVLYKTDKQERMEWTGGNTSAGATNQKLIWGGLQLFRIKRQGNQFQISDPGGVLPLHKMNADRSGTKDMWKQKMTLPTATTDNTREKATTIKRNGNTKLCVIHEVDLFGSRNEGDTATKKDPQKKGTQTQQQGLKIQFGVFDDEHSKGSITNATNTTPVVSLNTIKASEGVDAHALEASREQVEMEEQHQQQSSHSLKNANTGDATSRSSNTLLKNDCSKDVRTEGDDDDDEEDVNAHLKEMLSEIEESRETVQSSTKELDRLLRQLEIAAAATKSRSESNNYDDYDLLEDQIWDSRDSLREALMLHGSTLLKYYDVSSNASSNITKQREWLKRTGQTSSNAFQNDDNEEERQQAITRSTFLTEATHSFRNALKIVKDLEASCSKSRGNDDDDNEQDKDDNDDPTVKRTLCLLRGRAHVNLGIALFHSYTTTSSSESSTGITTTSHESQRDRRTLSSMFDRTNQERQEQQKKTKQHLVLEEAFTNFHLAQEAAKTMKELCSEMSETNPNNSGGGGRLGNMAQKEATLDLYRARELESFSFMWEGRALWKAGGGTMNNPHHQQKRKDAAKRLDEASTVPFSMMSAHSKTTSFKEERDVVLKCYAVHYDSAMTLVELTVQELETIALSSFSSSSEQQKKEGDELVGLALRAYKRAISIVDQMHSFTEYERQQEGIQSSDMLKETMKELTRWWAEVKQQQEEQRQKQQQQQQVLSAPQQQQQQQQQQSTTTLNQRNSSSSLKAYIPLIPTRGMFSTSFTRKRKRTTAILASSSSSRHHEQQGGNNNKRKNASDRVNPSSSTTYYNKKVNQAFEQISTTEGQYNDLEDQQRMSDSGSSIMGFSSSTALPSAHAVVYRKWGDELLIKNDKNAYNGAPPPKPAWMLPA